MRLLLAAALCVAMVVAGHAPAAAHALQPGYLELTALAGDAWRVLWRKPADRGRPMAIDVLLPANCDHRSPPEPRFDGLAYVAQWMAECPGGLGGGEIAVPGLAGTQTDVLVRYELTPGEPETHRLTAGEPAFIVPTAPDALAVLWSYLGLGVDHILQGADHLLFVLALLLLVRDRWRIVGAITAFTVAHSVTLVAATLGWIFVPAAPVEAVIALSIMFLASELLRRGDGKRRLSERYPWTVSFSFGLLHGLGFARALLEVGLPKDDVPLALLAFNLGVEAGQLMFVGVVVAIGLLLRWLLPIATGTVMAPGRNGNAAVGYAIGGVSAYWFVARIAVF